MKLAISAIAVSRNLAVRRPREDWRCTPTWPCEAAGVVVMRLGPPLVLA